jgi:hypothetical protein
MTGNRIIIMILPLMMLNAALAQAQTREPIRAGHITVVSEPPGAEVYRSDSLLGITPLQIGADTGDSLTLWYPSINVWNAQRTMIGGQLPRSNEGVVSVRFAVDRYINTTPSGALVYSPDSLMGRTPLRIRLRADSAVIRLEREGYVTESRTLSRDGDASLFVTLAPSGKHSVLPDCRENGPEFHWPPARIAIPAIAGVTSGVLAILLKQEANRTYNRYTASGDKSLLDRTRRFDIYAGIALAVLELGTGWIIYQILTDN